MEGMSMRAAWVVFRKELADALRDRRTWLVVMVSSMVAGPLSLLLLSKFVSSVEENVARREVWLAGVAAAPSLVNFIERSGGTVKEAPADFRARVRSGALQNAVVVVPPDFETKLARGEPLRLDVVFDDTSTRGQAPTRATLGLLRAYNRELGGQRLLARGVGLQVLTPVDIEEVNLASSKARGAQLLFLVPWLALLAAVVGAISVAIDVTAGERERGSLEPLLTNPVSTPAIVLGKWGVVAACSAAVVVLTLAGFRLAMVFVSSESLSALMQFGAAEAALFLAMLLPFAAMIAALNMFAATWGRTHKEAQTYASYLTMLVNIAPIIPLFLPVRDSAWQLLVPAMAQQTVMMRALRGESVDAVAVLLPGAVALATAAVALVAQARLLHDERIVFSR
jgi:sodium transport system permease protein